MAVAEISVIPLGTDTPSVSRYVARAVKVLQEEKDVKYELTAMGTIIEGELGEILRVAQRMHEGVFSEEVARVITTIEIDDRRDKASTIASKLESLKNVIARSVSDKAI